MTMNELIAALIAVHCDSASDAESAYTKAVSTAESLLADKSENSNSQLSSNGELTAEEIESLQ
jgi:hypothetical protein